MPIEDEADDARHLIVCCDGTNNTLTGGVHDTNVLTLVRHLSAHASDRRIVYYDPGVGSPDAAPPTGLIDGMQRQWERISGLASGTGIYDNVAQGYLFLMRNWTGSKDRIYCFGFSRGAFTARAIAGMVNLFGIVRPEFEALLPMLVRIYFSASGKSQKRMDAAMRSMQSLVHRTTGVTPTTGPSGDRESLGKDVRTMFATTEGREAWVHWVGVWDTVESVGLPGPLAQTISSPASFHDKRIRHVRHALALDEHRWTFEPRLYAEPGDIDDKLAGRSLKQRWFPGVHSDVGGGYRYEEVGLSNASLVWMIDEVAADLGVPKLSIRPPPPLAVRHDALWDTPWWALAGMCLRDMHPVVDGVSVNVIEIDPPALPGATIWAKQRKLWPVALAVVAGVGCLIASGAALTAATWSAPNTDGALTLICRASSLAMDQLTALVGSGLLAPGHRPWELAGQPAWSMFWDTLFIACYGYLLARIASRSFAWLAGRRTAGSRLPVWRLLGFMPLMAVAGDLGENALFVLSLALHAIGIDVFADASIWLGSLAAVVKFAGLFGCVPLMLIRPFAGLKTGSLFDSHRARSDGIGPPA